jgi:hypothetical protein
MTTTTARMPGLTAEASLPSARTEYAGRSMTADRRSTATTISPQMGPVDLRGHQSCVPDWACRCFAPGPGCPCCQDTQPQIPLRGRSM